MNTDDAFQRRCNLRKAEPAGEYRERICIAAFRKFYRLPNAGSGMNRRQRSVSAIRIKIRSTRSERIDSSVLDSCQISRRIVHDSNFVTRSRSLVVIRARSNLGDNDQRIIARRAGASDDPSDDRFSSTSWNLRHRYPHYARSLARSRRPHRSRIDASEPVSGV